MQNITIEYYKITSKSAELCFPLSENGSTRATILWTLKSKNTSLETQLAKIFMKQKQSGSLTKYFQL